MNVSPRDALCLSFLLSVSALSWAWADGPVLEFGGNGYVSDLAVAELSRTPRAAREATQTIFPFEPASPEASYSGPPFSLGYEVRASAPVNLTVPPERCAVENDFQNGSSMLNDTISIVGSGSWPESEMFSVAAVVVFPTKEFELESLSYSALNWSGNEIYNEKLRHRWVVQVDGKYYVNTGFLGRTGRPSEDQPVEVISTDRGARQFDNWVEYDPETTIFANFDGPIINLGPKLDGVTGVGLYMDALDFPGRGAATRQWQFRLITFSANGKPK
ncbi:MAG: hypothetical protein SFU53_15645 [Terrimicrobiaceae bacterium]|nr:hypothetical protein [Terrimicrobiaceae bacterium]